MDPGRVSLEQFEAITFDCYGTLIDWGSGIVDAVRETFPSFKKPSWCS